MYRESFGLDRLPFTTTPDPAFYIENGESRQVASLLNRGLPRQSPVCVVTGNAGMGKTALIGHVLSDPPPRTTVGLIYCLPGGVDDIHPWILHAFAPRGSVAETTTVDTFEDVLRRENSAGRRCVLIIDEAQNLTDRALEHLRGVVKASIDGDRSFALVLVGQSALRARLDSAAGPRLARHVGLSVTLRPMNARETSRYVRRRLSVAGAASPIFDDAALAAVHEVSGGCPRVVNTVCATAMHMARLAGQRRVTRNLIAELADGDSLLAHLPGISRVARSDPERLPDTGTRATPKPEGVPVLTEYPGQDVFEFMSPRVPDAAAGLPAGNAREAGEAQGPQRGIADTAVHAGDASAIRVSRARPEPAAAAPRAALKHRPDRVPRGRPRPRGRISLRRFLTGSVTASALVVGGWLFAPVAMRDATGPDPAEHVSMQRVAALAPVPTRTGGADVPDPPAPLPDMPGEALLDRAIEAGFTDPASAALDYARAALRGEERAAYFLGQLYEAGDGVPRDLALARGWYSSVEKTVRGAHRRLRDLGPPQRDGELAAPRPLLGGTLDSGGAEFVWTSGDGADPVFYVVELSDGSASSVRRLLPQDVSALKVASVGDARFWRVFAVAPDMHRYAASDWVPLGPVKADAPLGPGGVVPEALVQLPANAAPELLAEVTDGLADYRIAYRVESGTPGAEEKIGLQIGYFFEADETTARKIAGVVGARSAVMLAGVGGTDRPGPYPGQVVIRAVDR